MLKIHLINKDDLKLIANHFTVNSDKIIILAHGFTNDKSSNGRFDNLSLALNEQGYDALAIDFSGSGESDDAALTKENQNNDLKTAIDFAVSQGYKKIALFGNSFGSLACFNNYSSNIDTMILTGALTDRMDYDWYEYFTRKQMTDLENNGYFYTEDDRKHKITQQTLLDFETIDQKKLLAGVNCPVLIIHGDNETDDEELLLLKRSRKAMQYLSSDSELRVIKNGKHGLRIKWEQVIELTITWLNNYLYN